MDYPLQALGDIDVFFWYGEPDTDILLETESDLMAGILQSKRSLFYNRRDSAGVAEKENFPNSLVLALMTRYDITNWNSYRNSNVSDGSSGTPDRRVAMSQDSIAIEQNARGEMDVNVQFIPFSDVKQSKNLSIPIPT